MSDDRVTNMQPVIDAVANDEHIGVCTSCGAIKSYVSPLAHNEDCDECGLPSVCGCEDILTESAFHAGFDVGNLDAWVEDEIDDDDWDEIYREVQAA